MKFKNPFRQLFKPEEKLQQLAEAYAAAEKISDPGVKLLSLRGINDDAYKTLEQVNNKSLRIIMPPMLGGVGCIMAGGMTANPVLFAAGIAMMAGGVGTRYTVAMESFETLWKLRENCEKLEKETLATVSMKDLARSEKFEAVMMAYPALKEKFLLAASREKVLGAAEPAAKIETPRPGDNGGFRI